MSPHLALCVSEPLYSCNTQPGILFNHPRAPKIVSGSRGETRGPLFNYHVTTFFYYLHTVIESGQATRYMSLVEPFMHRKKKVNGSVGINLGIEAAFRV